VNDIDPLGAVVLAALAVVAAFWGTAAGIAIWRLTRRRRASSSGGQRERDDLTAVADATREPLTDEQDEALYDLAVTTWNPDERALFRAAFEEQEAEQ
jgi:hypothetical protein